MDDRLTIEEQQQLLEAARSRRHGNGSLYRHSVRDEFLLWLMINGGLTSTQVCWLGCADVRAPYTEITIAGKRDEVLRPVPLLSVLPWVFVEHVKDASSQGLYLFNLSTEQVRRMVRSYGFRSRIARVITPRTLRRTYAHEFFARKRNLPSLARALGFKDVRSAATYLSSDVGGENNLQYNPEGL